MNNKSPLRYPGGKTRACHILDEILIQYFDANSFTKVISPFFGGGSFEFYLQNKYNYNLEVNDKFHPLYRFWLSCKQNNEELCRKLYEKLGKIDKSTFQQYRNSIMSCHDDIETAVMYFILNRCSFSGATLSGGFSKSSANGRFTKSSIDRIKNLDISHIDFYNLDFIDFLKLHENDELIFVDPPYYLGNRSNLYGNNGDMHETFDHEQLHACLSKKRNWILTYNDCEYIRELYKNYIIIETKWTYGMNKSKKSSEIVIICQ